MALPPTPLGLRKPDGSTLAKTGDDDLSFNAQKTDDLFQEDRGRLTAIEAVNLTQDNRLTVVESESTMQEATLTNHTSRLDGAETKNASQDTRIDYADTRLGPANLVTNGDFRNGLTGWTNTGAWVVQTSANGVTAWARTMSGGDGSFAQSITIPAALLGKTLRLKVLAMTTSVGTLLTSVVTTAGTTSLTHALTTAYVERTLDVVIPVGQGTTPITLNVGRFSGTVYMTAIRLEAL